MTAFDNIKTNNWPATSNDFEDFCVLKLPLNDQASLTESLPVAAGSKELFPKRTLTNSGVLSAETGLVYSANSSGGAFYSTGSWAQAFDGSLTTGPFTYSSTSNTLTLPPGVTWSNKIRVYALRYGGVFEINGTSVTSGLTTTPAWKDLTATLGSSGTLTTIEIGDVGTNYVKLFAVELDDQILVNAPGGSKKHYDNNAVFSSSKLIIPQHKNFQFGDGDFTIEAYINPDNVSGTKAIVSTWNPGSNRRSYTLNLSNASVQGATHPDGGSGGHPSVIGGTVTAGAWSHVAFVRDGSTLRLFVNGTQVGTTTASTVYSNTTDNLEIGAYPGSTSNYFAGKIQDVRIYKGVAKYTSNFTPPAAILD